MIYQEVNQTHQITPTNLAAAEYVTYYILDNQTHHTLDHRYLHYYAQNVGRIL